MYDIVESGKRIASLRKNAGYTQEQFGEKIGLSYRSSVTPQSLGELNREY